MNKFKRLTGVKVTSDDSIHIVSTQEFLGKIAGQSFGDCHYWQKYGSSLRDTEAQQLDHLFQYVKKGARMTGSLIERKDKGGRPYVMASFIEAKATIALKVVAEGPVLDFIKAYQQGKIAIDFTLDELIETTMND